MIQILNNNKLVNLVKIIVSIHFLLTHAVFSQNNPQIKIMPLGDSITKGTRSTDRSGYRRKLYLDLTHAGQNVEFVGTQVRGTPTDFDRDHEGHGAFCAKSADINLSLVENISSWLNDNTPDIILLHIGTNDIGGNLIDGYDTPDEVCEEIDEVLEKIDFWESTNSKEIIVFLAKIVKITPTTSIAATKIEQLNSKLDSLSVVRNNSGDKIVLVDVESEMDYSVDISEDGYHPTDLGYEKISDVWFSALMNYFPTINLKVYFEGSISANNTSEMNTQLTGLLPLANPFNSSKWNYYGSESVPIADFDPANNIPDFFEKHQIVDWMLMELRTSLIEDSIIYQRAVLVDKYGNAIDFDGKMGVKFGGLSAGNYYLIVHHRNHLSVMSSSQISLN